MTLEHVQLDDFASGGGLGWTLLSADVQIGSANAYDLGLRAAYKGRPLAIDGQVSLDETMTELKALDLKLHVLGSTLKVVGSPDRVLSVDLQPIDLAKAAALVPQLSDKGVGGIVESSLKVEKVLSDPTVSGHMVLRKLMFMGMQIGDIKLPLHYSAGLVALKGLSGVLFTSPIAGSFFVNVLDPKMSMNVKLSLKNLDFTRLGNRKWLPALGPSTLKKLDVDLHGPALQPTGKAVMEGGSVIYGPHKIGNLRGALALDPKQATVDISGAWINTPFTVRGTVGLTGANALNLRATLSNLALASLTAVAPPMKGLNPKGSLSSTAVVTGTAKDPHIALEASAASAEVAGQRLTGAGLSAEGGMKKVDLKRFAVSWMGGKIAASGSVSNFLGGKPDGFINASIEGINSKTVRMAFPQLDRLNFSGKNIVGLKAKLASGVPSGTLDIRFNDADLFGVVMMRDIKLAGVIGLNGLKLSELSARFWGGGAKISGLLDFKDMKKPRIDMVGQMNGIDASKIVTGAGVKGILQGRFKVSGPLLTPFLDVSAGSKKLDISSIQLKDALVTVNGSDKLNLQISGISQTGTKLAGGGTIVVPRGKSKGVLDLKMDVHDLDLRGLLPKEVPAGGVVSVSLLVKGTPFDPQMGFKAWGQRFKFGSFAMQDPIIDAQLNGKKIALKASMVIGDRRPELLGTVTLDKNWRVDFNGGVQNLSPASLAPGLKGMVQGSVSALVKGSVTAQGGVTAAGSVDSKSIGAMGLNLTSFSVPFKIVANRLTASGGGNFCGGRLSLNAGGNLNTSRFTGKASLTGVQVAKMAEPFKVPGKYSGTANLNVNFKATSGMALLLSADGVLRLADIHIEGIPYLKVATSGAPLRIKQAMVSFNGDSDEFYIMPGSSATAWPDDKVFHYVEVSGPAWRKPLLPQQLPNGKTMAGSKDEIKLDIAGNINIRALNGLLKGVGIVIQNTLSGNVSGKAMATDFLTNLVGGAKEKFRDVSFQIAGTYAHLKVQDFKIQNDISLNAASKTDWTDGGGKKTNAEPNYKLQFKVPVGPGSGKGDSIGKQATGEILGNIVKGVMGQGD